MKITGGCFCGNVRFTAEVDPEAVVVCHCNQCQRLSGSPYRVSVLVSRDDVRILSDGLREYWKTAENGNRRAQAFCETCGGPVLSRGDAEAADEWVLRWGMIDQRADLPPRRQIWCEEAAAFANELAALPGEARE
ncbi:GFA family protein [Martelella soudanensis]|uniref:GFA family protein n=1 Tax=unclassified Martelella TaxID=2629616 RepID=UPI0015DE19FB|nr:MULTISPECIES: GFA family protein [unclassified Martelella]